MRCEGVTQTLNADVIILTIIAGGSAGLLGLAPPLEIRNTMQCKTSTPSPSYRTVASYNRPNLTLLVV